MAETSLRAYVKEIDEFIEHERLDEAIAHCRHILETYPKHLDTYRLLGKAYLEAKRYGDAADLFQRVLSAVPDDFVAHIGMAIVREDEGNVDASIWHMERAFETNPANPAIQQELRRLIGKRDGLEPHKVRLTRGALARMYAHGELYPQAVAELRSALQEDPERPDLQVLLANLYWRSDQRGEAAELGERILEKLPYCRDANRIVAAALQAGGKVEQAAVYHRRLAGLDPYAAFVETAMVDPQTIDPASVHVAKLAWQAGQLVTSLDSGQPEWAASLGVDLRAEKPEEQPAGPMPSWLDVSSPAPSEPVPAPAPAPASPAPEPTPEGPVPSGEPEPVAAGIPDWMRGAGWSEATGAAIEGSVEFSEDEVEQAAPEEAELAPAEIPDWLKDIAPAPAEPSPLAMADTVPTHAGGEQEVPEWMGGPPSSAGSEQTGEGSEGLGMPTWLDESSPGATETIVSWLGDRTASVKPAAPDASWIGDTGPLDKLVHADEQVGEPRWLSEPAFSEGLSAGEAPGEPGPPAWLSGVAEAASVEKVTPLPMPADGQPPAPRGPEAQGARQAEAPEQETPDWLKAIAEPASAEAHGAEAPAAEQLPEAPYATAPAPDWLQAIVSGEAEPRAEAQSTPDWLRELPGPAEAPPSASVEPPDWLQSLTTPEPSVSAEGAGRAPGEADWLASLTEASPGPEPVTTPASKEAPVPVSQAPDWLRELTAAGAGAEPAEPREEAPGEAEAPAAAAVPEWMQGVLAPERTGAEDLSSIAASGSGDWLQGLIEPEEPIAAPAGGVALPGTGDLAPEWFETPGDLAPSSEQEAPEEVEALEGGEIPAGAELSAGAPPAPPPTEAPDWLREFADAAEPSPQPTDKTIIARRRPPAQPPSPPETPAPTEPALAPQAAAAAEMDDDEIYSWLETLAARQDITEPGAITGSARRSAQPPAAATPPAAQTLPEEPEEGLEWLEQLAGEPPATSPETPVEEESLEGLGRAAGEAQTEAEAEPAAMPQEPAPEQVTAPAWLLYAAESEAAAAETPASALESEPVESAPPSQEPEPLAPEPEAATVAPEWLQPSAEAAPPPEPLAVGPEPAAAEPTPEWLARAVEPEPAASMPEPPASTPARLAPEPEPEWLRPAAEPGPAASMPEPPVSTPAQLAPEPEPEWLRPAAEPEPAVAAAPEAAIPEWLRAPAEPPLTAPPLPPEASAPRAAPPRPKPGPSAEELLEGARQALADGEVEAAMKQYGALIKRRLSLERVIEDLQAAIDLNPGRSALFQALGDAYMKDNRVTDAIEAYRRGLSSV